MNQWFIIILHYSIIVYIVYTKWLKCAYNTYWYCSKREQSTTKPGKEDRVYDEVETHSETEIKNVQLESNLAYQPFTIEGSVQNPNYEEVEMKLTTNPAYEQIGQAHISKTKPVYANL